MGKGDSLSPWEHMGIGALAGAVEVTVMQPTVGVKNALQQNRPVPRNPLVLYRGLAINAGSMAPITAVQFGANRFYEQILQNIKGGGQLSQSERIGVAAVAGATSALVSCPAELIMIQQQRTGGTIAGEAKRLLNTYGVKGLYRGMTATVTRETLYTMGYLGVVPVLRDYLEQSPRTRDLPPSVPTITAAITGGLLAAVASQPADTVKTRMQAFLEPGEAPQYRSASSTVRYLIQNCGGISSLFSGMAPRAVRTVGAAFILTYTRDTCIDILEKRKEEQAQLG